MINENLNNDFIINNNVINYIRIIDINDLFKKARQYQNLNIEYKDLSLLEIIVQKFEAHDFFINTSNGKDPSILDLYNFLDSCVKLNDKEHKVFFVFKDLSYSESSKELINSLYDEVQKLFGPNGRLYEKIKFYLNEIIDINNNKANKDQSFMNIEFIAFNQFSQNIINDMDAKKDIQNGIPYPYFSSRINDNFKKFSLGEIDFFIEKYGIDINKEFKNATEFYTYIIKDLALKFFKDTNKELFDIENELDSKFKKNKEELVVKIEKIFDNYLENFIQSREEECKIIHNLKRFTSEFDELDNNINKQTCEKINKIKKSIHEAQDEIYNNLTKDNNPIEKRNEFYENLNKIIDSINFDDKNISYNLYTSKNNIKEFYKFINIIQINIL